MRLHCRRSYSRVIYDLRFTFAGPHRWVVRYVADLHECRLCGSSVLSEQYPPPSSPFGHGLCSWAIYSHVALRQSFKDVCAGICELFAIPISHGLLSNIKPRIAKMYGQTQSILLAKLRASHVLYVDETKVNVHGKVGYVWAFTNLQEVVYLFSTSRDGAVLDLVLEGFKGVLVSDFYGVYDSPSCEQQKCVVHFVRDLKCPFGKPA
jgi:hypothetical protein